MLPCQGKAKVDDLGMVVLSQHDIAWMEISVLNFGL
jgi:hypothetical protein